MKVEENVREGFIFVGRKQKGGRFGLREKEGEWPLFRFLLGCL